MNDQQFAVLDQLTLSAEVWHGEGLLMHGEIEHMTDRNDQYCCFMNFLAPRLATQHWTKDKAFNAAACNDFTRQLQVVVRVTDKVTMRTLKIFRGLVQHGGWIADHYIPRSRWRERRLSRPRTRGF